MKREDIEGAPCLCPECHQAGVSELPLVRDPQSAEWLHGYRLKRWYEAKNRYRAAMDLIRSKVKGFPT